MLSHPSTAADLAADTHSQLLQSGQFGRHDRWPAQNRPSLRTYRATYLSPESLIEDSILLAPALDVFENAHSAFGRGTLIATPNGNVAVEDLLPGDLFLTKHIGPRPLVWKGSMETRPDGIEPTAPDRAMTRISADSLGIGRPMPDLVLGPSAYLFRGCPR